MYKLITWKKKLKQIFFLFLIKRGDESEMSKWIEMKIEMSSEWNWTQANEFRVRNELRMSSKWVEDDLGMSLEWFGNKLWNEMKDKPSF